MAFDSSAAYSIVQTADGRRFYYQSEIYYDLIGNAVTPPSNIRLPTPYPGGDAQHISDHTAMGILGAGDNTPGNPRSIAATVLVDWANAGVSIGTPTTGWTVTTDSTVKYGGFSSLKVHTSGAAPGGGTTLTVVITIPSTLFGNATRLGFAIRSDDRYAINGGAGETSTVWIWIPNGSGTKLYGTIGDYATDAEWTESIACQGDFSTAYHVSTGGTNWSTLDTAQTTVVLSMSCRAAGIPAETPVYISPIFGGIGKRPAIVSLMMDGPYASQFSYLRPLLKAFDFRATMGVVVPNLGTGAYMTEARCLKMCAEGHIPIHHTGAGSGVGWGDTSKYPDATVSTAIADDINASWSRFSSWGYTSGIGYGGVGWSNGLAPTVSNLARRQGILAGARAAGMVKMATADPYYGPYYGHVSNGMMTPITQFSWGNVYSVAMGRLHDLCARGGWAGFRFHELKTSGGSGVDTSVADVRFFLESLAECVDAGRCVVLPYPEAMQYLNKASLNLAGGY